MTSNIQRGNTLPGEGHPKGKEMVKEIHHNVMYCHSAKGCEPAFIITETKGGKEKEVRSLLIKVLNCFTNMQNLYKKCIEVQLKKKKKAFKHTITKLLKS